MIDTEKLSKVSGDIVHPLANDELLKASASSEVSDELLHLLYSLPQGKYAASDLAYMAAFPTRFIYRGL
ncbi:hypothetical protein [Dehalogenimonas etheniformans]|uniref:Uncharacterized protein n=1 Tax=Dehalogenimonas etheniformans TaxID=1536648 RepID=A0A2P5PA42_9CHLR|nr:hypothetical protein [Dehalogenimonas etheniformans]PPD59161.1 hypothetical protein JP09_000325 [Dehalogenimonas etheniformans]QNT75796.1 hypothetical protein HX448_03385 [Dehalogenimonas etheniformans]